MYIWCTGVKQREIKIAEMHVSKNNYENIRLTAGYTAK